MHVHVHVQLVHPIIHVCTMTFTIIYIPLHTTVSMYTHCIQLIDIQPSKSGGFKGTLPAKLVMAPVLSQELSSQPRKKLKLNDGGRENRSPGGQKTPHRSFSRRKRYTPHKMPDEILQNVVVSEGAVL